MEALLVQALPYIVGAIGYVIAHRMGLVNLVGGSPAPAAPVAPAAHPVLPPQVASAHPVVESVVEELLAGFKAYVQSRLLAAPAVPPAPLVK